MNALWNFFLAAGGSNPTPPDNSVKIAIITAISVVLAAAITGFATVTHRRRDQASPTPVQNASDYIAELLRRAEVAERHVDSLEYRNESLTQRVDELERVCWQHGIDPNSGELLGGQRNQGDGSGNAPAQAQT